MSGRISSPRPGAWRHNSWSSMRRFRDDVQPEQWQQRVLDDGSRHRVYKRYFRAGELAEELGGATVLHEGRWFVVIAT